MISLQDAKEWDKLRFWIGIMCMVWLPRGGGTTGVLEGMMLSFFHQQPGALQKLEEWMEQCCKFQQNKLSKSFKQTCKQAHNKAVQQATL